MPAGPETEDPMASGNDVVDLRDGRPGDFVDGGLRTDVCHADVGDRVRRC